MRPNVSGDSSPDKRISLFASRDLGNVLAAVQLTLGSPSLAEEAVAEGVARAWERLRRGDRIDSLEGWVFVVAVNYARRTGKRLSRQRSTEQAPEARRSEQPDPLGNLTALLIHLPLRQRTAVVLRYWFDLPLRDIAVQMEVAEGTVKALLSQGRANLRSRLADAESTAEPGRT